MKRYLGVLLALMLIVVGCSGNKPETTPEVPGTGAEVETDEPTTPDDTGDDVAETPDEPEEDYSKYPQATITMHTGETMVLALMPESAPNTVNNFIELAESGFYNGLTFHTVIEDFKIIGGDPLGNGTGGPGYTIKGEFSENGFENTLSHKRGTISMERLGDVNSAGSQFFICHKDSQYLDGQYAAFGVLIDGEETLDRIAMTPVNNNNVPKSPEQIKSISILRNGYELGAVEKVMKQDTKDLESKIEAGLPFAIGTQMIEVVESWGEYNSYDYLLGGLYYMYDDKYTLFFSNGYTTDKGVELGEIIGVAFFEESDFLGISIGMAFEEIQSTLGEPKQTASPEENENSELYGGGWTMTYETDLYQVVFSSTGDEQKADSIYIFKR